jgi:hypothetical protein
MHRKQKLLSRLKRIEGCPLPESLERAFSEIQKPMARYADSETTDRAASRGSGPRIAQSAS